MWNADSGCGTTAARRVGNGKRVLIQSVFGELMVYTMSHRGFWDLRASQMLIVYVTQYSKDKCHYYRNSYLT